MTDARLPGRWLTDPVVEELSDKAWRVMTGALMWSNEQGTDGKIPRRSLRLLHPEGADGPSVQELISAGFWVLDGDSLQCLDWVKTQSLARDVDWQRERNRQNQAAKRERDREKAIEGGKTPPTFKGTKAVTGDVSGESSGDVTEYTGGKASSRTGEDLSGSENEEERQPDQTTPAPDDNLEDRTDLSTGEIFETTGVHRDGQRVHYRPRSA